MTSNISSQTLRQLQLMVNKLKTNRSYMAWIIAAYQKQEKLTPHKFIELVNIDEETLAKLSLCKRPETGSKEFAKQVKQISDYTKIDALFLANIIRHVESVNTLSAKLNTDSKNAESLTQLGLAVARDRTKEYGTEDTSKQEGDNDDLA